MQRREVIYALLNELREIKTRKDLFLPLYVQMLSLLLGVVHTPDVDGVSERLSTVFQLRGFCLILGPMKDILNPQCSRHTELNCSDK